MIPIPSPLVEFILLGPLEDRRQLQDSPILGDVWVEFGKNPANPLDLLIAPYRGHPAGFVATKIDSDLDQETNHNAEIAFLQGLIVARLAFEELIRVVRANLPPRTDSPKCSEPVNDPNAPIQGPGGTD